MRSPFPWTLLLFTGCWPFIAEPDPREGLPLESDADTDTDADSDVDTDTDTDSDADVDCPIPEATLNSDLGQNLVSGNTCSGGDDYDQPDDCGGFTGPDVAFSWIAPFSGSFEISLSGSMYDTVMVVHSSCPETTVLQCNDDFELDRISVIQRDFVADQPIVIAVEGYSQACGNFQLSITELDRSGITNPNLAPGTLLITEVVDHAEVAAIKFVELYNPGPGSVRLTGWELRRYSNGNTSFSSTTLPDIDLPSNQFWVLASAGAAFTTEFGPSDQSSIVVNGNGNDAYALYYQSILIDSFGEVGVDGFGTSWDYTDSVAQRDLAIAAGNPVWEETEWIFTTGSNAAEPGMR